MNVQQLMSPVFQEAVLIKLHDDGVLVGALDQGAFVGGVEPLGALDLIGHEAFGLSRSSDAAGGAGHHFDKVEMLFAAFNEPDQIFGVAQSADHGGVDGASADFNGKLLGSLNTPDAGILDLLQRRVGSGGKPS